MTEPKNEDPSPTSKPEAAIKPTATPTRSSGTPAKPSGASPIIRRAGSAPVPAPTRRTPPPPTRINKVTPQAAAASTERDPACAARGRHCANCSCQGDARAPMKPRRVAPRPERRSIRTDRMAKAAKIARPTRVKRTFNRAK